MQSLSFSKQMVSAVLLAVLLGGALTLHGHSVLTNRAAARVAAAKAELFTQLVDLNHPLTAADVPQVEVADAATGKLLQTQAAAQYRAMAKAAQADGVSLMLCSGYRSYAYQQKLYAKRVEKNLAKGMERQAAEAAAKTVVAYPGCSEHQTGLAADIVTPGAQALEESFENTDAFRWLAAHGAEYGFILRYPKGKEAVTHIIYEPWHWRYVGKQAALIIKQNGLCLEEYQAIEGNG